MWKSLIEENKKRNFLIRKKAFFLFLFRNSFFGDEESDKAAWMTW